MYSFSIKSCSARGLPRQRPAISLHPSSTLSTTATSWESSIAILSQRTCSSHPVISGRRSSRCQTLASHASSMVRHWRQRRAGRQAMLLLRYSNSAPIMSHATFGALVSSSSSCSQELLHSTTTTTSRCLRRSNPADTTSMSLVGVRFLPRLRISSRDCS